MEHGRNNEAEFGPERLMRVDFSTRVFGVGLNVPWSHGQGITRNLDLLPDNGRRRSALISSFSYEYWNYLYSRTLNFHFQPCPYYSPEIFPDHQSIAFHAHSPSTIFPSTPALGHYQVLLPHHINGGVMVFPGDQEHHHLHYLYFQPMVQFSHITSVPLVIHGGYVPYYGEQQYHMNFHGVGRGFVRHHHPAVAAPHALYASNYVQHFHGYYGSDIFGFMTNIAHTNIMEQESLQALGFGVENMTYEAILALQDQIGYVSTGLREEDILSNLGRSRYQMIEEECPEHNELCCICFNEFCNGDAIGKINCIHKFHFDCIAEWLKCKNSCPSCRGEALSV